MKTMLKNVLFIGAALFIVRTDVVAMNESKQLVVVQPKDVKPKYSKEAMRRLYQSMQAQQSYNLHLAEGSSDFLDIVSEGELISKDDVINFMVIASTLISVGWLIATHLI